MTGLQRRNIVAELKDSSHSLVDLGSNRGERGLTPPPSSCSSVQEREPRARRVRRSEPHERVLVIPHRLPSGGEVGARARRPPHPLSRATTIGVLGLLVPPTKRSIPYDIASRGGEKESAHEIRCRFML
jgi:hypothetical protein